MWKEYLQSWICNETCIEAMDFLSLFFKSCANEIYRKDRIIIVFFKVLKWKTKPKRWVRCRFLQYFLFLHWYQQLEKLSYRIPFSKFFHMTMADGSVSFDWFTTTFWPKNRWHNHMKCDTCLSHMLRSYFLLAVGDIPLVFRHPYCLSFNRQNMSSVNWRPLAAD